MELETVYDDNKEFQQQKLTFAAAERLNPKSSAQNQEEITDQIDIFVGVISPLMDPFNIFVRVKDLNEDAQYVYFYCYSLGKAKAMLWGVYEKATDSFFIDDACEYNANYLSETLKKWQANGYKYAANQTKNRFNKRITLNLIYEENLKTMENAFELYKEVVSFDFFLNNPSFKIKKELLEKFAPEAVDDDLFLIKHSERLKKDANYDIKKIESNYLNKSSVGSTDYGIYRIRAVELALQNGLDKRYADSYLFVLLFMDDADYRAARYIASISENQLLGRKIEKDLLDKMNAFINESFIFAWLNRVTSDKELQIDIAEKIVDVYERLVNYSDAKETGLISKISVSFMNFIAKSEFSKRTLVKKLKPCYTPRECEGVDCAVFEHGHNLISTYDYDLR